MPKRQPDPLGPEPGRTTAPMPNSPYQGRQVVSPPPPPAPINPPVNAPLPPSAYGSYTGTLPSAAPPPKNRGGSFAGGIVAALLIVVALGAGLAVLSRGGLGAPQHTGSTIAQGQTTPAPTTAPPGVTPTTAPPTVTPTATATTVPTPLPPHTLPPPPSGFTNFLPQGDDWGLNYPIGTQVYQQPVTLPTTSQTIPSIVFSFGQGAAFVVYDLPSQVPSDQEPTLLKALADALHATNIQILDAGSAQLGANTWQEIHLRATIGDQPYEGYCLYIAHHATANAVTLMAPQGTTFTADNTTDFQPMIDSFTYLS